MKKKYAFNFTPATSSSMEARRSTYFLSIVSKNSLVLITTYLISSRSRSKRILRWISINKYSKRVIETSKVIEELIALAKEMNDSYKAGEASGLIKEEISFYDALASHDTAVQVLGDDILKVFAHELTKAIKENISIDWNLRDSARAKMRITVR